jgi:hypothetical protein
MLLAMGGKKHPPAVLWQTYFERKCTLTPIFSRSGIDAIAGSI